MTVLEEAVPPQLAVSTNEVRNAIFAGLLSLVSAMAILLIIEHLDDTVRSPDDVLRTTGFHNLGELHKLQRGSRGTLNSSATELQPHSKTSEAFRSLRTNIDFVTRGLSGTLLVTSGLHGEGKTTVAAFLAVAFAQTERTVLLVDADFHRPSIHRTLGLSNRHGLRDLLEDQAFSLTELTQATRTSGLRVLTAGQSPPNPFGAVDAPKMKRLLRKLAAAADVVILDCPPILASSEAAVLASAADATVVVVAAGRTPANSLRDLKEVASRAGATVIGTVLNRVAGAGPGEATQRYVPSAPRVSQPTTLQADSEDL